MKRLILAVAAVVSIAGGSVTALADDDHYDHHWNNEDHHDHNWNDEYWHHEHYGYWHGERGYWENHHHKHVFVHVGPVTIEH